MAQTEELLTLLYTESRFTYDRLVAEARRLGEPAPEILGAPETTGIEPGDPQEVVAYRLDLLGSTLPLAIAKSERIESDIRRQSTQHGWLRLAAAIVGAVASFVLVVWVADPTATRIIAGLTLAASVITIWANHLRLAFQGVWDDLEAAVSLRSNARDILGRLEAFGAHLPGPEVLQSDLSAGDLVSKQLNELSDKIAVRQMRAQHSG